MRCKSFVEMALSVRQLIDLDGQNLAFGQNSSSYVTDQELAARLNEAVARLWKIITTKFGQNYFFNTYVFQPISGVYTYQLPYDFKDVISVSFPQANGNQYTPILPYNVHEQYSRNYANIISWPMGNGSSLLYQMQGQLLSFIPTTGALPANIRVQYTPCAPILVATLPVAWPGATQPVSQWTIVSANVTNSQGVTTAQTFIALNSGTTGSTAPTWNVPGTVVDGTGSTAITWSYVGPTALFQTYFDGISGWEYIAEILTGIRLGNKQEQDTSQLRVDFADAMQAIEEEAWNRQSGDSVTITPGYGRLEGGGASDGLGWGGSWGGV